MTEEQRRAVADRLRAIADRAATDDLAPDDWSHLLDQLSQAEQVFAADPQDRTRFARNFVDDARHPIEEGTSGVYPPIDVDITDDLLVARIRFGPAWEGPPDLVHGGFLAAGFDMCLSAMAHHVLGHSVTRRLHVRYLKPTFVGADLRYEVEADEPEGRLLSLRGRLYSGDQVTMRASAQFASLDQARFADRRPTRPVASPPGG